MLDMVIIMDIKQSLYVCRANLHLKYTSLPMRTFHVYNWMHACIKLCFSIVYISIICTRIYNTKGKLQMNLPSGIEKHPLHFSDRGTSKFVWEKTCEVHVCASEFHHSSPPGLWQKPLLERCLGPMKLQILILTFKDVAGLKTGGILIAMFW